MGCVSHVDTCCWLPIVVVVFFFLLLLLRRFLLAFEVSLMAISKHLKVMGRAGLIRREKDGRVRRCSFDPGSIEGAGDWIEAHRRFWTQQLDSLAAFLEEPGTGAGSERLPNKGGEPQ